MPEEDANQGDCIDRCPDERLANVKKKGKKKRKKKTKIEMPEEDEGDCIDRCPDERLAKIAIFTLMCTIASFVLCIQTRPERSIVLKYLTTRISRIL